MPYEGPNIIIYRKFNVLYQKCEGSHCTFISFIFVTCYSVATSYFYFFYKVLYFFSQFQDFVLFLYFFQALYFFCTFFSSIWLSFTKFFSKVLFLYFFWRFCKINVLLIYNLQGFLYKYPIECLRLQEIGVNF